MRCKNCGWPNQPGETNCVKCHAPLEMSGSGAASENYNQQGVDTNLKKTVLDVGQVANPVAQGDSGAVSEGISCPQCGFPMRPGSQKCPKCGAQLGEEGGEIRRPTVINEPENNTGKTIKNIPQPKIKSHGQTVNIYIDGFEEEPECFLKPVKRNNEKKEPENIVVEGDEVSLRRDNTDPGNMTIASKVQAVITREDNKWYITDRSETHTTFVRAGDKTPIEDGSLILLGNRLFEFHIQ